MIDVTTLTGDVILGAATIVSSYTARRAHKSGRKIDELANGLLDQKIMQAVEEVLVKKEGDEIRQLMNAIIRHSINVDAD